MIYLNLLFAYLKIGLFGFGGGYAMLSLIKKEMVDIIHRGDTAPWFTQHEFTDIIAIAQMTPGSLGVNSATYFGYSITGSIWGSVIACLGLCLPSSVLVMLIGSILLKNKDNKYINSVFKALRIVVVGLISSAALLLMNHANFPDKAISIIICASALVLVRFMKIHPIIVITLAGIVGILIY